MGGSRGSIANLGLMTASTSIWVPRWNTYQLVIAPVNPRLQLAHTIPIPWDPEDPLARRPSQREDRVGQEGKDHGDLVDRVRALLEVHDLLERLAVYGGVECRVLSRSQPRSEGS
jgi:hypothetical protein